MGGTTPKQLLPFDGEPLVRRAARTALAAGFAPVIVVVGNDAQHVAAAVADLNVTTEPNEAWALGLGASLKRGAARAARESPAATGILICLADQPGVTPDHLANLARAFRPGHPIASLYADTPAVPAILPTSMLPEIAAIPDSAGAKSLLTNARTLPLNHPDDIDTPEDYARLTQPK